MMKDMEKIMHEALKNMDQQVPRNLVKERRLDDGSTVREMGPIVYGYSVKIGEDGKPVVRKFGNINSFPGPLGGTFSVSEQREPGVSKEDLRISANETSLAIESISGERRYHKRIDLPDPVDPSTGKSTYKNGILEISFSLKNSKERGIPIDVD
jgi:HSP20 family protein